MQLIGIELKIKWAEWASATKTKEKRTKRGGTWRRMTGGGQAVPAPTDLELKVLLGDWVRVYRWIRRVDGHWH